MNHILLPGDRLERSKTYISVIFDGNRKVLSTSPWNGGQERRLAGEELRHGELRIMDAFYRERVVGKDEVDSGFPHLFSREIAERVLRELIA